MFIRMIFDTYYLRAVLNDELSAVVFLPAAVTVNL